MSFWKTVGATVLGTVLAAAVLVYLRKQGLLS